MASFFSCFNTSIKLRRGKGKPNRNHMETLPSSPQEEDKRGDQNDDDDKLVLRRLSWNQIQRCTSNFSTIIGSGGFSNVYLAHFPGVGAAAVKVHCGSTDRLAGIYKQELQILKGLRHDHIVKLLGSCQDREEGVLVFEYVPNGTLQEKLHGETKRSSPNRKKREVEKEDLLPWRNRVKIAFQLAQSLEYLHHQCPLQIVHGDIKASNILLDHNLDSKLCDFGSAKMGFSSAVLPPSQSQTHSHSSSSSKMMMMGSPGYTDPHYLWTGIVSKKNDIYSFGVVVLELITGMEALNPVSGERLTTVSRPILRDPSKVVQMVDARLSGFDLEEVKAMAAISAMCLNETPSLRPSASDIVNLMRNGNAFKFHPPPDSLFSPSKR